MAGGVDRLANFVDRRKRAGRGFVVKDADRLDFLVLVFLELGFDGLRIEAMAPVGGDEFRLEPDALRHLLPQRGELPSLDHQHAVAGRHCVGQRGFPRAGAGRGVDDPRVGGLENRRDAFERLRAGEGKQHAQRGEIVPREVGMFDDARRNRPDAAGIGDAMRLDGGEEVIDGETAQDDQRPALEQPRRSGRWQEMRRAQALPLRPEGRREHGR